MERGSSFRRLAHPGDPEQHLTAPQQPGPSDVDGSGVSRKRSLVKPERQRLDPDHPQFHYQQVAREQSTRIHVQPSATGNEPMLPQSHSMQSGMSKHSQALSNARDSMLGVVEHTHEGIDHHTDFDDADDDASYLEFDEEPEHGELKPPGPSAPEHDHESWESPAPGKAPVTSHRSLSTEHSPDSFGSDPYQGNSNPYQVHSDPYQVGSGPGGPSGMGPISGPAGPPMGHGGPMGPMGGVPMGPGGPGDPGGPGGPGGPDGPMDDFEEFDEKAPLRKPYMPKKDGISLWRWYCRLLTFPIIPAMMRPFGMTTEERQMAWREKIGLISVIMMVGAIVGFLTFGFTQSVCDNKSVRVHQGHVMSNTIILSGAIYEYGSYGHPAVTGISANSPIAYPPVNAGGKDLSFMFQNVNGNCKQYITPRKNATIPHNDDGEMGWYFPCQVIYPGNGSLMDPQIMLERPEKLYDGWGCHTHNSAREQLYKSGNRTATVYYTWGDLAASDKHLVVFNGDVLNLDYLNYLLTDELEYPKFFDELREDTFLKGEDVTQYFGFGEERKMLQCLREITKVGEIDTDTIGCIASDVVLYTSLVFIIGLVAVKFLLACYFRFFMARKQGAYPISESEFNQRERNIEEWGDDEFSPARKFAQTPKTSSRPKSVLLEKLTAPHVDNNRISRVTMATQNPHNSTSRVVPGGSVQNLGTSLYRYSRPPTIATYQPMPTTPEFDGIDTTYHGNEPEAISLHDLHPPTVPRSLTASPYPQSMSAGSDNTGPIGPLGSQNEYIVPQPPVGYQPWGYPLAHTICMVTAYSESVEGLRTTLDSLATTEYPNSHKMLFIVCDGIVKGSGNDMSTPEICLSMMTDFAVPQEEVRPYSYVSVVAGAKRHNMAKVYAGFYKYDDATVPREQQQRIPAICVVKCGTPAEVGAAKPGNRGKRDSQIILMSFLQRIMFDERMTELEFELYNGILSVTGIPPDYYETLLMVDADTKVYPDCLTHMNAEMVKDPEIMGLCGETKIANKTDTWVTMIQVFEYFISHHQAKAFESVFGGVTCLPGCFSMYRIKSPKGAEGFWVPILCNPDIVERYSDNVTDTLHKKNLLLLGEDRYLSTLMLKTFPKRKMIFVPKAACKTIVPDTFKVLLSQRRRWINSTIHNLMELLLVSDLCGVFVISMQFVVFIDLVSTLVLPAAISFTLYIVIIAIVKKPTPVMSLVLLALILGLPGLLIVVTATRASYVLWMLVYLAALPVWNFVLPMNAYWRFDDFSWGDTRTIEGGDKGGHDEAAGEFDASHIVMKRWREFQRDREYEQMQNIQAY